MLAKNGDSVLSLATTAINSKPGPGLAHRHQLQAVDVDVRDRKAMEEAIANLPPSFAKLRGLINNAGLALGLSLIHI